MRAYERLLEYVKIKTPSDENSMTVPSSLCQFTLAERLVKEMKELGIEDAAVDEKCYVYGTIPASEGYEDKPCIGFIAHMDTVAEFTEEEIHPIIHENYNGEDLVLSDSGRSLEKTMFSHLETLRGRTLITSDGKTILGADDKAGVAEILTLAEKILKTDMPHGKIAIGFTPDEEIGTGADHFDVEGFGADFAYTVDGGAEGEIEYENFNACEAVFEIEGINVHPGSAKGIMINAASVACEIQMMLPQDQVPEQTEEYEGFYHLTKMSGSCEKARLEYIVRDHDAEKFAQKEAKLQEIVKVINQKYKAGTVTLTIKEQYRNMAEKIRPCFHLIENAKSACKNIGIEPKVVPIRGGTDGARLSYMGLPCPNLGTGGYAFHGPYEHITMEGMDKAVSILEEIVKIYAESSCSI